MKRFRVKVNGQVFEVEVEEIKESPAASQVKTTTNPVPPVAPPVAAPPQPAAAPAPPAPASISASMPGNILSVKVKEGERVKAGQLLLILEAMKMENEILAPAEGVIKKIYVAAGQSVNTGDPLIALE